MPGPLLQIGATAMCPHGGQVSGIPSNPRVLVGGQSVAVLADQFLVAGCAFNISGAPHPCVRVQWTVPATRVLVMGQPALLQTSVGLCLAPDQAPQGPAIVAVNQPRVVGM